MFTDRIKAILNRLQGKRVTALVGAGACLEIGGPSTNTLTNTIRRLSINDRNFQNINFIDQIAQQLNTYYGSSQCNFEDIFHTIEDLHSYGGAFRQGAVKDYKPVIGAFVNQLSGQWFDSFLLIQSADAIIREVASQIDLYNTNFINTHNEWFSRFWFNATNQCSFDIATLNYDTCIEQSVGAFEDGFETTGRGFYRFNVHQLLNTKKTRIIHPHGSVVYGHLPSSEDPNHNILDQDFHDLYKFDNYNAAQQTWFGRSNRNTQSHEQITVGPILTGLRKTDKILSNPYSDYYYMLQKAILENDSLLIVGYSFGDKHINNLLERFTSLHSLNRRIVIITYCDPNDWCPDPSCMDWMNHDMATFIYKAFRDTNAFGGRVSYVNPFVSTDGRAKVYLSGFRDAVDQFGDDIIDFLTT